MPFFCILYLICQTKGNNVIKLVSHYLYWGIDWIPTPGAVIPLGKGLDICFFVFWMGLKTGGHVSALQTHTITSSSWKKE